ncbi:MAG TPA: iron-containing redox enzyme family protein [Solirubrobacteraceae bacterium]|jgi:pyrroloquinoline-quinone synthase
MDILQLLDDARRRIDVLQHPFYQRWNAGELTAEELAFYAGEYRHAVVALADASELAAQRAADSSLPDIDGPRLAEQLGRHAAEERSHVDLWDDFAAAASFAAAADAAAADGAAAEADASSESSVEALPQTQTCADSWTAGEELLDHLAVLYAIEGAQPAISTTKLTGLKTHYGFEEASPGLSYFKLHAELDVEHADQAGRLLRRLASEQDSERLLFRAEAALRGNWTLLDGVQERFAVAA